MIGAPSTNAPKHVLTSFPEGFDVVATMSGVLQCASCLAVAAPVDCLVTTILQSPAIQTRLQQDGNCFYALCTLPVLHVHVACNHYVPLHVKICMHVLSCTNGCPQLRADARTCNQGLQCQGGIGIAL
jgi:hypothetical protein